MSFLDTAGPEGSNAVLELTSSSESDGALSFEFIVLDGAIPAGEFGTASLFIDNWFDKLGKKVTKAAKHLTAKDACNLAVLGGPQAILDESVVKRFTKAC